MKKKENQYYQHCRVKAQKEYLISEARLYQEYGRKNIVDVLVEVNDKADLDIVKNILINKGWLCMNMTETRITLNKGYTEQGFAEKVFHLHIRIDGDNDELYFRDYLNEHKEIGKEYEALKTIALEKI